MFFIMLRMKKRKIYLGAKALTAMMALVIGIGIAMPISGGALMGGTASALGRDATLTGRTDIWGESSS